MIKEIISFIERHPLLLVIMGAIITFSLSALRNFKKKRQIKFIISRSDSGQYKQAEIYNCSGQDIVDFNVQVEFKRVNEEKTKQQIAGFIKENEDRGIWQRPCRVSVIKKLERLYIPDFPFKNLEGDVTVVISGKGADSGKIFSKSYIVV